MIDPVESTEPAFRLASLRGRNLAIGAVATMFVVMLALGPFATHVVGWDVSFLAALFSATTVVMLVSSLISYNWYVATNAGPYAMFATAYGAAAVLIVPYAATRPALAVDSPFAGRTQTSAYLWVLYHLVFIGLLGIAIASQAYFQRRERFGERIERVVRWYVAIVAAGLVVILVAVFSLPVASGLTGGDPYAEFLTGPIRIALIGEVALVGIALIGLTRLRRQIDLWLAITLAAAMAELVFSTVFGATRLTIGWYAAQIFGAVALDTLFIAQFHQISGILGALARDRRVLASNAGLDAMTGLMNRRGFDEQIELLWRAGRHTSTPLALIIIDIDFFKQYNDLYGHSGGDEALRLVARAITTTVRRPADICARIGGEEFALILPRTDSGGAFLLAEKIRHSLESRGIQNSAGLDGRLTASFGVAASNERGVESPRTLHERADEALYEAKRLGRNRVFSNGRQPVPIAGRRRA